MKPSALAYLLKLTLILSFFTPVHASSVEKASATTTIGISIVVKENQRCNIGVEPVNQNTTNSIYNYSAINGCKYNSQKIIHDSKKFASSLKTNTTKSIQTKHGLRDIATVVITAE